MYIHISVGVRKGEASIPSLASVHEAASPILIVQTSCYISYAAASSTPQLACMHHFFAYETTSKYCSKTAEINARTCDY